MADDWKQSLKQDGYCQLRGIVPQSMIGEARAEVGRIYWAAEKHVGWVPMSGNSKTFHGLLRESPLADYVEQALGWNKVDYQKDAQIVLRRARETKEKIAPEHHMDGFNDPPNCYPFSLLVGIFLNRTPDVFNGNFAVWPGTHYGHEKYFRERTPDVMKAGMPKIGVGEPKQLITESGDAVLCHFQLAHGGVVNTGDTDFIAVYIRVWQFMDHWKQLTNLWEGWKI